MQYITEQCNMLRFNATYCNATYYNAMEFNTLWCNAIPKDAIQYIRMQCKILQSNGIWHIRFFYNVGNTLQLRQTTYWQTKADQCNTLWCNVIFLQCKTIYCNSTQYIIYYIIYCNGMEFNTLLLQYNVMNMNVRQDNEVLCRAAAICNFLHWFQISGAHTNF